MMDRRDGRESELLEPDLGVGVGVGALITAPVLVTSSFSC